MCDHDGLDWKEIALAAALAEEILDEEREKLKAQKEVESGENEENQ